MFPPRLGHLLTRAELVARLASTYAAAHEVDEREAREIVDRALRGRLRDELLDATWAALRASSARLTEDRLLEKVARSITEAPLRRSRAARMTPELGAALVRLELEAGAASEAARRVLESGPGREAAAKGLAELGAFLAREATRR